MANSSNALALAELEPCASALLPVLLAFLHTRVAGHQAFGLEHLAQFGIELDQRAGNAQFDGISLCANAAALDGGHHIEAGSQFDQSQRALGGHALLLGDEVDFECLAVDLPLARAGTQKDTRDRRFAPPRPVILNQICHCFLVSFQLSAISLVMLPFDSLRRLELSASAGKTES